MASSALLGGDVLASLPSTWGEVRHLFKLALPMMLNFAIESLYAPISIGLMGHLGTADTKAFVDGATMGSIYMMVTTNSVGIGFGSALDTLATQAHGAGNYKKMGVCFQSAVLGTALVYLPSVLLNLYCKEVLVKLGINSIVADYASQFVRYSTLVMPFYFLYDLIRKMLQAHDIVAPMVPMTVVSNALHVGLGLYFTQVLHWGFQGAVLAGCLSEAAYPFMQVFYLVCINPVHKQWKLQWNLQGALAHLPEFFTLGLPGMLMMLIECGAFAIVGFLAGELPHSLLLIAVNSILVQTISTAFIMYIGFSTATTVRMGNAIGANDIGQAKAIMRVSLGLTTACLVVTTGGLFLLRFDLPRLYVADKDICERAAAALLFALPLHVSDAYNAMWQAILQAVGRPAIGASINAAAYYIVGLPLAGVLSFHLHWGLEGLWIGLTSGSICACLAFTLFIARLSWSEVLDDANARTSDGDHLSKLVESPPLASDGATLPVVLYT